MTQHCEWNNTTLRQQSVFENSPTSRRPVPPTNRTRSRSTNQRGRASQASRPDRVTILPQRIEATSVMAVSRCGWATNDPLYIAYHDREWGSPLHDDRGLFELLILEGAQAGLSWITILRKRDSYRSAFDDFEPSKIAGYGERKLAELLDNPGIIRKPTEDRSRRRECQSFYQRATAFWQLRHLYLAVRQSHTCAKCKGGHGRHSKLLQRIGWDEQGFEKARLQVRWDDDLLRFYAGDWDGQ